MCDVHSPFYNHSEPIARLVHRCDECGFRIMPGERYLSVSGKWEGEFSVFRAHELCDLLARQVATEDGCRTLGYLYEAVGDADLTPMQARWASSLLGRRVLSTYEMPGEEEEEAA